MTEPSLRTVYLAGKKKLGEAGLENPAFDAVCLCEAVFGAGRQEIALYGDRAADPEKTKHFFELVSRRAKREPLQPLLGEWCFLDLTLSVPPGVLIPRPETELLCEVAAALAEKGERARCRVLDLCAGTGAVGLGLRSLSNQVCVTCVEWFAAPYRCLEENCGRYPMYGVKTVRADVLAADTAQSLVPYDMIVANPPYIATGALPGLMPEVRHEPQEALDGGEDGLRFYRAIAENWVRHLSFGGWVAVEIGEEQAPAVCGLFEAARLCNISVHRDCAGLARVVCAEKQAC